jgi:hypothetical protein
MGAPPWRADRSSKYGASSFASKRADNIYQLHDPNLRDFTGSSRIPAELAIKTLTTTSFRNIRRRP